MDENEKWFRNSKGVKFLVGDKIECIQYDRPCHVGDVAVVHDTPEDNKGRYDLEIKVGSPNRMVVELPDGQRAYMIQDYWRLL